MLRLQTLGQLGLRNEAGDHVEFPAGKPLALLIRIAVGHTPPDRRELIRLLWPRSTLHRGQQSVRQALWFIRRTLGDDVLEEDGVLRLRDGAVGSDIADLENALAEGRIADADALWRGPFLHRFAIADAPEWDRWVDGVSDDLSRRLAGALSTEARHYREAGDLPMARRQLERAAEIAPFEARYREELVEWLVEVRDLTGAERALDEARRAAAEPEQDDAVHRLSERVERLRSDRASLPDERFARPDLVGRSAELADLLALWRRAEKGSKRIALLTGPAGIGKTRLADEFARTIQHEGACTVTVRAAEVEHAMEYGVVASLARSLLQMSGAAGISTLSDSLLRGLVPSLPVRGTITAPPNGERPNPVALADALADLVGAVAWERPLLITVDDAGWADPPSITALARAIRTLREGAVMVVMTARTPGGVDGVLRPLESLRGDVAFGTIRLRPLTLAETHELVTVLVDLPEGVGARRLLDRIHRTTGGNPFFVIELIRAFRDERLVATDDGNLVLDLSRLDEAARWPKTVRALVRRRFERLSPRARALGHLLGTVSPRDPETAARRLAGLGRRAYGLALSELLEHGVVAWDGSALAFTHAELREEAAAWVEEEATTLFWRRWSPARIATGTAFAALAVFAAFRVVGFGRQAELRPPPYGGGEIIANVGDSIVVFRAEWDGDTVLWRSMRAPFPVPDSDRVVRPLRTVGDSIQWYRMTRSADRGPDLARVDPVTNAETIVIGGPGDESFGALSPDGAWIAFGSDDTTTAFDPGLHMVRSDGSEARLVHWHWSPRDWSRDGRFLTAVAQADVDTMLVITPSGRILKRRPTRLADAFFCGVDGWIVFLEQADSVPRIGKWNWRTGEERILAGDALRLHGCSPDGTGAVVSLVRDWSRRFGVLDLDDGEFHDLNVTTGMRIWPGWLAERGAPVPSSLELLRDTVTVDWGGADSLRGRLLLSDGNENQPVIEWSSSDSSVATVLAGVLRGNRPGNATVTGCVDDWVCDSLRAVVADAPTADLLFEDRFHGPLDTRAWIPFGLPSPRTVTAPDGEPVLLLAGDAVWRDGIITRRGFSFAQGVTLELEFRFRGGLSRRDKQSALFCLVRYNPASTDSAVLPVIADQPTETEAVCFTYPAGELDHFEPDVAYFGFSPGGVSTLVRAPDLLPPVSWTHVAVEIRSDGSGILSIGHRQVAALRVRIDGLDNDDWRIELSGHSVETRLEVRYVALWKRPPGGSG